MPVVTWKHPRTKAILLRSASFVVPAVPRKKAGILQHVLHSTDKSSDTETVGILSADIEGFISTLVSSCPKVLGSGDDTKYWSGSFSQDVSMPPMSLRFDSEEIPISLASQITSANLQRKLSDQYSAEDYLSESSYRHSFYASTDQSQLFDWESTQPPSSRYVREMSFEDQPMTLSSFANDQPSPLSLMPLTSMSLYHKTSLEEISSEDVVASPVETVDVGREELMSEGSPVLDWSPKDSGGVIGRGLNKKSKKKTGHVTFASIPTNPRDWVVMDALKDELHQWETLGLYIIGEKHVLMNVSSNVYPDCTMLPVEVSI